MQFMFVLDLNTRSSTQVSKIPVMPLPPVWMFVYARIPSGRKAYSTVLCETTQLIDGEKNSRIKLFFDFTEHWLLQMWP